MRGTFFSPLGAGAPPRVAPASAAVLTTLHDLESLCENTRSPNAEKTFGNQMIVPFHWHSWRFSLHPSSGHFVFLGSKIQSRPPPHPPFQFLDTYQTLTVNNCSTARWKIRTQFRCNRSVHCNFGVRVAVGFKRLVSAASLERTVEQTPKIFPRLTNDLFFLCLVWAGRVNLVIFLL